MTTDPSADAEPEWAMQLVVHVEKSAPPSHIAVCEAAAMSVVAVLTAPQAAEGEWRDAVRRWESGPIRKVARRARGVRWRDAQDLPGITVDHHAAQVRAFVPGPVDLVPPALARLQVAGLDLREEATQGVPGAGAAPARPQDAPPRERSCEPPHATPYAEIALNPDVSMSTGKAAAQCGHAAHLLLRRSAPNDADAWTAAGLRVRLVTEAPWSRCVDRAAVAVRDAGFTEVPAGTMTAVAWLVR